MHFNQPNPSDSAEPSAIDPPLLPGRPRLSEAPPTPHGRGVSDPVHLSPARDMVTLAGGCEPQNRGLHAEGGASSAERSRTSTVRIKAEAHPVRRGQGPVSARRGGGGVAEVGCESVSAPSKGAARGGGGVRRRGRAVAGRGRGRAAQTQCEMSSASALYHAERALRSPEDAGALTRRPARAQRLQGWVW